MRAGADPPERHPAGRTNPAVGAGGGGGGGAAQGWM